MSLGVPCSRSKSLADCLINLFLRSVALDASFDGEQGEFHPVGHTNLLTDSSQIVLACLLGDEKLGGYLVVVQTSGDLSKNRPLLVR